MEWRKDGLGRQKTRRGKAVEQRMDREVRENSNRTKRSTLKNFQRRRGSVMSVKYCMC